MTRQRFHLPDDSWEAESDPATPVFLAGPYMYQIASIGGQIHPYGDEHLVGRMGGAWAHPIRVLHGWTPALQVGNRPIELQAAQACDLYGTHIVRHYAVPGLHMHWTEFVGDDAPVLVSQFLLHNTKSTTWQGQLLLHLELDLRGCWFGGWGAAEQQISVNGSELHMTATETPYANRAVAILGEPTSAWQLSDNSATIQTALQLAPGQEQTITIVLAVTQHSGTAAASTLVRQSHAQANALLEAKRTRVKRLLAEPALTTPDPLINRAWQLARLNLDMLQAAYPDLPRYLLAGLPEYPQLFGCDTEYSAAGATAAGFVTSLRSTLTALAGYAQRACARVPHEVTTNGRVFHAGNTQETPQFAVACRDYLRWSGDIAFVESVYPLCVEGLDHFEWTLERGGYPHGDGVVERLGMGSFKLDSVCYLYQALVALEELATALDRPGDAARFRTYATGLQSRFEQDWWLEQEGVYADSMQLDGQTQLDGHWTVVIPIQTGLAQPERAERSMQRIADEWVNQWGLVHTRGSEPRVWTLPTGLLAMAAFEYRHQELGVKLLRNIAVTAEHGSLGTLKELIPQGICFIQLWSAGMIIQGLAEGLCGLHPEAHYHRLTIRPRLPADWPAVRLHRLSIGSHILDIDITHETVQVVHHAGSMPLEIHTAQHKHVLAVGRSVTLTG